MGKKIILLPLFLLVAIALAGIASLAVPPIASSRPVAGGVAVSARVSGQPNALAAQRVSAGERGNQDDDPWIRTFDYNVDSRQSTQVRTGSFEVHVPDAAWMRVFFGEVHLAPGSHLLLTSALDGAQQRIDAAVLQRSAGRSAYFNGDTVQIELQRLAGEGSSFFRIDEVLAGSASSLAPPDGPTSICGSDNRVLSSAGRVARLTFVRANGTPRNACTAWLTNNGSVLSAGHCVDFDPDGFGPGLPDGVLDIDANDVIEFDPPASTATGALVFAAPEDQYSMDLTSFSWGYDGEGQGLGKDWAVFRIEPNDTTGQRAHVAQGFFRMTRANPSSSATIRITGYGTDSSPDLTRNQVQQTHSGSYVNEGSSGADFWHRYKVDTTGGNSGSPIIWDSHGTANYTIGIHTNAGCNSDGSGANAGTSFEHNPLESALQIFPASFTRYVDRGHPLSVSGNGTIFFPYDTVFEGEAAMSSFGRLSIVNGNYNETGTFDAPMVVDAPVGNVIIGQ